MRVGGNSMHIVTAEEMYELEHITFSEIGIPSSVLMYTAGNEIAKQVMKREDPCNHVTVMIGSGNNGGDGFVVAHLLKEAGFEVIAIQAVANEKVTGDAAIYKKVYLASGGLLKQHLKVAEIAQHLHQTDIVIDALLGIGIKGTPKEEMCTLIEIINQSRATVYAIDIPSGVPIDRVAGEVIAVQADVTYCLIAYKMSAFLKDTAPFYGETILLAFGIPANVFERVSSRQLITQETVTKHLPKRDPFSHKGSHGRGLVIGGSAEMPGSITMTARAALRTGAGLLQVATIKRVIPTIAAACQEAMYIELTGETSITGGIEKLNFATADAVAIGPGMTKEKAAEEFFRACFDQECTLIIDADGLTHLKNELNRLKDKTSPVIITPHPKEMAWLCDCSVNEILADPFQYAARFAKHYQVYVILKGTYTIIASPDGQTAVNTTGNPGLAKGGSGDVLTGMVLGMVLQMTDIFAALCNAVYMHGRAADILVERTHAEQDLLATDVLTGISDVYRSL